MLSKDLGIFIGFIVGAIVCESQLESELVITPSTAAAKIKELKATKYRELAEKDYLIQPASFEVQRAAGSSINSFFPRSLQNGLRF